MNERFTLASTARLHLDVVDAGVGIISQTPTAAVKRLADGRWFQASDGTWQTTIVENDMAQSDSVNLPGRYHFDFDQSKDAIAGSVSYIAKLSNGGASPRLEYRDLVFGPMPAVASMALCSVQGTIISNQGEPVVNIPVKATLVPVFLGGYGRAVDNGRIAVTYTNELGSFDLPLVRGGIFRLEIDAVGYDRKVTIPNQSSVLFTDL
jgi:hypothetical protein